MGMPMIVSSCPYLRIFVNSEMVIRNRQLTQKNTSQVKMGIQPGLLGIAIDVSRSVASALESGDLHDSKNVHCDFIDNNLHRQSMKHFPFFLHC